MIERKIINNQGVILKCKIYNNNGNQCILFIPGLAQSFDNFAESMAIQSKEFGFDFIFPIVQNSGIVRQFKQVYKSGKTVEITRGACFDRLHNSIADIDCLVKYATDTYNRVFLVGYCFGCDKILYYLKHYHNDKVTGLTLVAPQDIYNTIFGKDGNMFLRQARQNVKSGNQSTLIDKKLFSFCDVSSGTYLDMVVNKDFYQFPVFSESTKKRTKTDLNIPVQLIIGERDRGICNEKTIYAADEYLHIISDMLQVDKHAIIPHATHSFSNSMNEVVDHIMRFAHSNTQAVSNLENKRQYGKD